MKYKNKIKFMVKTSKIFYIFIFFPLLFMQSCSNNQNELSKFSPKSSFGYIVTEEPQATVVGLDMLKNGGSAADAVVASFFMLSVTYPVAAGLGSGGVCIVHDSKNRTSESIDFRNLPISPDTFIGIPRAVRAMSGLQARYGNLKWSSVVLPSEKISRFGFPASRATSSISKSLSMLEGKQNFKPFVVNDIPIKEGQVIVQEELAETLSKLRLRGGGDLYFGELGRKFFSGIKQYGLNINFNMLRDFQPDWQNSKVDLVNELTILTPYQGTSGSISSAYIIKETLKNDKFFISNEINNYKSLAEFSGKASYYAYLKNFSNDIPIAIGSNNLDENIKKTKYPDLSIWKNAGHDGSTSIVAIDKFGQSIACGFSMGSPFGMAKNINELGFSPGIAFSENENSWLASGIDFLAPMIISDKLNKEVIFVLVGTKGPSSMSSVSTVVLNTLKHKSLDKSIRIPRIYFPLNPHEVWVEKSFSSRVLSQLNFQKIAIKAISKMGHVNAVYCPNTSLDLLSCEYISDPRGSGLGLSGELF